MLLQYEYDAMGNQRPSYPWSSGSRAYCAYTYDEQGRHTGMSLYASEQRQADELLERNTYSYDASGRLYKLTRYDVNGALECCVIYQYKD